MTLPRCPRLWSCRLKDRQRLHKTSATNHSPPPASALHLPLDIWLPVLDHLPPHDLLHLSHTCKTMRSVAARHFPDEVRNLSPSIDGFQFVAAFALTSLEHWACIVCSRLHRVDFTDVPTKNLLKGCPNSSLFEGCSPQATYLATRDSYYVTRLRHVQLALKYAGRRRLDLAHEQYLKDLMAPYLHVGDPKPHFSLPNDVTTHLQYRAQPKIATLDLDGGSGSISRYLLCEEWRYTPSDEIDPSSHRGWAWSCLERNALRSLTTCCHQDSGWPGFWPRPSTASRFDSAVTPLRRNIEKLLNQSLEHSIITFSCGYCPTDFELCFEDEDFKGRHVLVIRVWKDLRTSREEGTRRTDRQRMWDLPQMTDYNPGDTRYMYEHGGGRPEHTRPGACAAGTSRWKKWSRRVCGFGFLARRRGRDKKERDINQQTATAMHARPDISHLTMGLNLTLGLLLY